MLCWTQHTWLRKNASCTPISLNVMPWNKTALDTLKYKHPLLKTRSWLGQISQTTARPFAGICIPVRQASKTWERQAAPPPGRAVPFLGVGGGFSYVQCSQNINVAMKQPCWKITTPNAKRSKRSKQTFVPTNHLPFSKNTIKAFNEIKQVSVPNGQLPLACSRTLGHILASR